MNRVLQQVVSTALLGSLAACGSSAVDATESNVTKPVVGGDGDDGARPPEGTPTNGGGAPTKPTNGGGAPTNGGGVPTDGDGAPGAEPPPDPAAAFEVLPCLPAGESQFEHMRLAREYDYAVLRSQTNLPQQTESQASGEPCSGASQQPACLEKLAATWPTEAAAWRQCVQLCSASGVVLTTRDQVELLDNAADLREWLGSIDTPYEAALLAQAHNFAALCDETRFAPAADGFTLITRELVTTCPVTLETFTLQVSSAGVVQVTKRVADAGPPSGLCIGRRPAGLADASRAPELAACDPDTGSVGEFFAEVARLEASAVHAFRIMATELRALGAPRRLERAAGRAARDEVRHAKLTARLARRHGTEPRSPEVTPRPLRPLFELALENVVEGCVRETYGAACGRFQAARARDAGLRAELDRVALDEARHAELSWRIHGWAEQRLSPAQRQELQRAARKAIADLRQELERHPGSAVCDVAGMPAPAQARALLDALEAELWSPSGLAAAA